MLVMFGRVLYVGDAVMSIDGVSFLMRVTHD